MKKRKENGNNLSLQDISYLVRHNKKLLFFLNRVPVYFYKSVNTSIFTISRKFISKKLRGFNFTIILEVKKENPNRLHLIELYLEDCFIEINNKFRKQILEFIEINLKKFMKSLLLKLYFINEIVIKQGNIRFFKQDEDTVFGRIELMNLLGRSISILKVIYLYRE